MCTGRLRSVITPNTDWTKLRRSACRWPACFNATIMIGCCLFMALWTRTGVSWYRDVSEIAVAGGVTGNRIRRLCLSADSSPASNCCCSRSSVCCHSDSRVPANTTTMSTFRSSERAATPSIDAVLPDCTDPMTRPFLARPAGHESFEGSPCPNTPRLTMYRQSASRTSREVSVNPLSVDEYLPHHVFCSSGAPGWLYTVSVGKCLLRE